jgi:hypothetical protein
LIDHVEYLYSDENGTTVLWAVTAVSWAVTYTLSGDYDWSLAGNTLSYSGTANTDTGTITLSSDYTWDDTNIASPNFKLVATQNVASALTACPATATLDPYATCALTTTWVAGVAGGNFTKVTVLKSELPDYFKIGSNEEDLKIFKL